MSRIPLFPASGVDQAVLVPVFLGVLVVWAFTEWFGWVFAGLVVPGYLASVAILHPIGAVLDVVEAVITFGVARAIGELLPRTGLSSRVFGRERFLLIVLVSIVVRIAIEGVLLPAIAPRATWAFSIGLVVVPLAANACWKTGLVRGAFQIAVCTTIVWALLRFVLLPCTNLSIHGFALATANVAAGFLATPRLYIVLVTGAVLASIANVRWGWDFNGILVPALLALVVAEPARLVATVVEALVVYAIGSVAARRIRLEGPRRTVFFFAVDFALRFAFAHVVGNAIPAAELAGAAGFGYLLPTLLAVKMAQKGSVTLVALPAVEVAVASFFVGGLVALAARTIAPAEAALPTPVPPPVPPPRRPGGVGLAGPRPRPVAAAGPRSASDLAVLLGRVAHTTLRAPTADELVVFEEAIVPVLREPAPSATSLSVARRAAAALSMSLVGETNDDLTLYPEAGGLPLVAHRRRSGNATAIVATTAFGSEHVREVALRLGFELDAGLVLVGEPTSSPLGAPLAALHVASASKVGALTRTLVVTRADDEPMAPPRLAGWGTGGAWLADVRVRGDRLGLRVEDGAPPARLADFFLRTLPAGASAATLTVGTDSARAASLAPLREALRRVPLDLPLLDGSPCAASARTAAALEAEGGPTWSSVESTPFDARDVVRRAAQENSEAATRRLARGLEKRALAAAFVRAPDAEYLAVAWREASGVRAAAFAIGAEGLPCTVAR